ncbi:uncharacterized protein LOC127808812 [Diospyros lotus]|uniref:uncharacterized protein LOC127808812 n=1 Tax=Diospyros lotus TaxID=55363 RepID=UPI00225023A6|nr:uncharacterized protein LOC127808812 [Diospyros lotus]
MAVHVEGRDDGVLRTMVAAPPWGTWEELILGGAVLRHGTQAWAAVASELRARTLYPYSFTPEACKAKYEDLQRRYSGCTAWFEELRKRRVAELRQELERSKDSIGSLESKLENLKAEKGEVKHVGYGSSQPNSALAVVKSEGVESCGKDNSKDGLSAGSFTQDIQMNWLPKSRVSATAAVPEIDVKSEISESSEQEKTSSFNELEGTGIEQTGALQRRRGKIKRKICSREPREGSTGENVNLHSSNVQTASRSNENSTSNFGPTVKSSIVNDHHRGSCVVENNALMGIFNCVAENENALAFQRRLDSQKRARYRKIIRQHVDFDTIRSRIASFAISSVKELFRDMLLVANNALVFYSRRTREYKTALFLRDIVTEAYQQHCKNSSMRAASPIFPLSLLYNPPVKPRSIRPRKHKLSAKLPDAKNIVSGIPDGCRKPNNAEDVAAGAPERCRKPSNAEMVTSETPQVCRKPQADKGVSQAGKIRDACSDRHLKDPIKERKRAR